jgi:hypothetical protein
MQTIQVGLWLVCALFSVLFLQSAVDKITDREGNMAWLTPHFAATPFRGMVGLLLSVLTLLELCSGLATAAALVTIPLNIIQFWPTCALGLCGATLLSLFAGQRIAKDYAGAVTIATYFGVLMIGLYFASLLR